MLRALVIPLCRAAAFTARFISVSVARDARENVATFDSGFLPGTALEPDVEPAVDEPSDADALWVGFEWAEFEPDGDLSAPELPDEPFWDPGP